MPPFSVVKTSVNKGFASISSTNGPPPALCTMLDLANAGPPPTNATVVYDPAPNTNRMSITRIAAGGTSFAFGAEVVNTFDI